MAFSHSQVSYSRISSPCTQQHFQSNERNCTYKTAEAVLEVSPQSSAQGAAVSCQVI